MQEVPTALHQLTVSLEIYALKENTACWDLILVSYNHCRRLLHLLGHISENNSTELTNFTSVLR